MIQSLRNLKLRIRSIQNTQKITRAMQMVSASKLNRVKAELYASRPYFSKLKSILEDFLGSTNKKSHPLLEKREDPKNIYLCVVTSDAGLCGVYNQNLLRLTDTFINTLEGKNIKLFAVGKEGVKHFKKHNLSVNKMYVDSHGLYSRQLSNTIALDLIGAFLNKTCDEIYIAYTHFNTTLHHKAVIEKLLNIECGKPHNINVNYITEPNANGVLNELLPKYMREKLHLILLDAFTSEHSARMIAMKTATDNADEMVSTLTLLRNKARQAAITKEVLEIAMSAEALKG